MRATPIGVVMGGIVKRVAATAPALATPRRAGISGSGVGSGAVPAGSAPPPASGHTTPRRGSIGRMLASAGSFLGKKVGGGGAGGHGDSSILGQLHGNQGQGAGGPVHPGNAVRA